MRAYLMIIGWALVTIRSGGGTLGRLWENRSYASSFQWTQANKSFVENRFNYNGNDVRLPPSLNPGFYVYRSSFTSVYDYISPGKPLDFSAERGSQICQDFFVASVLGGKRNGFFVDIAANDWEELSNTIWLENIFHFKGICVEPNPMYHYGILANRRCVLITNPVGATSGEIVQFANLGPYGGIIPNTTYRNSTTTGENRYIGVNYETVSLLSILEALDAPRIIEYLSLDVEGAEYNIMKSFDFGRYTFLVMTVERPIKRLHRLLFKNKYHFLVCLSGWGEMVYIHETLPNFNEMMLQYGRYRDKIAAFHDAKGTIVYENIYNDTAVKLDCETREASFGWHNKSWIRPK